jgi:threonine dehydratase
LKLETQQPTGAFKVRPAFNGILCNLAAAKEKGVITTSSGNFAQAVAYASKALGVKSSIVMTQDTSPPKVRRTQDLGGEVIFCGTTFESRFEVLSQVVRERGNFILHGFDSDETIAGNATLALELTSFFKDEEFAVLTPASGGGLIAGIASLIGEMRPDCSVYGLQPEKGGALARSLAAGERVNVGKVNSIADALVASMPGERAFAAVKKYSTEFQLISESEMVEALRFLFEEQKLVAEPGASVGVAALIFNKLRPRQKNLVCVISGGNIESGRLGSLLAEGTSL